jgi:hypothetical protein
VSDRINGRSATFRAWGSHFGQRGTSKILYVFHVHMNMSASQVLSRIKHGMECAFRAGESAPLIRGLFSLVHVREILGRLYLVSVGIAPYRGDDMVKIVIGGAIALGVVLYVCSQWNEFD